MAKGSKRNTRKKKIPAHSAGQIYTPDPCTALRNEKRYELILCITLLFFGAWQSYIYFGHQVVPNSDFQNFVDVGKSILHFNLPSQMKRLPVLGILQITLSKFMPGFHPVLTAGWFLNALLHPFNILLVYLLGRHFFRYHAIWPAMLYAINPWILNILCEPLVETTMIFFTLITFFFIFRNSRWCYLFASIASMVRYECAVLIFVAVLYDLSSRRPSKKDIYKIFAFAAAASVPIAFWLIATKLTWNENSRHYVSHFMHDKPRMWKTYPSYLWQTTLGSWLQIPGYVKSYFETGNPAQLKIIAEQSGANALASLSKLFMAAALISGLTRSIVKRNWKIIAVTVYFLIFAAAHSSKAATLHRYCVPIIWAAILLICYGIFSIGTWTAKLQPLPKAVTYGLASLCIIVSLAWTLKMLPNFTILKKISTDSAYIPYAAIAVSALSALLYPVTFKGRKLLLHLCLAFAFCNIAVCSQYQLALNLGSGSSNDEFRLLAEWFEKNTEPDDKLVTTMDSTVAIFIPDRKYNIRHISKIKGVSTQEFIADCRKQKIDYIAWDSRLGFAAKDSYYQRWGMDRIKPLYAGKSVGPFEYITTVKSKVYPDRRYIYIYKLKNSAQ